MNLLPARLSFFLFSAWLFTVFLFATPAVSAQELQYNFEYTCSGERVVVGHCRRDSDQAGFPRTTDADNYCAVYYPDRPKRGGFEVQTVELRDDVVKKLQACGVFAAPVEYGEPTSSGSSDLAAELEIANAIEAAAQTYRKEDKESEALKRFDLAVNKYRDIIARYPFGSYPKVYDAYERLGAILSNDLHKYDKALPVWKELRSLAPDKATVAILLGQTEYQLKHYDNSLKAFNDALALKPSAEMQGITHVSIGYIYRDQGKFDKATAENLAALRVYPGYTDATHALGVSYYGLKNYAKAIEAFQQAIQQKYTPIEQPYNWIGYIYNEQKEYGKALPYLLEIHKINPEYPNTAANLGHCYIGLKRNVDAIAAFKEAIRLEPNKGSRYYDLGHAYLQIGQKERASEIYNNLLKIDRSWAQSLLNEINPPGKPAAPAATASTPKPATAISGAATTKSKVDALLAEAGESFQNLDFAKSVELCTKAASIDPRSSRAYLCIANSHYEASEYQPAVDMFAKYFRSAKPEYATIMSYGDSYFELNQYDKAIPLFRQAIGLTMVPGEKAGAQFRLGKSYYDKGDYAGALEPFRQDSILVPGSDDAWYYLGMCYMRTGKRAEAQQAEKKLEPLNKISAGNLQSWIDGMK
jgi:tetratricopeptide (TPR) repeat protein